METGNQFSPAAVHHLWTVVWQAASYSNRSHETWRREERTWQRVFPFFSRAIYYIVATHGKTYFRLPSVPYARLKQIKTPEESVVSGRVIQGRACTIQNVAFNFMVVARLVTEQRAQQVIIVAIYTSNDTLHTTLLWFIIVTEKALLCASGGLVLEITLLYRRLILKWNWHDSADYLANFSSNILLAISYGLAAKAMDASQTSNKTLAN